MDNTGVGDGVWIDSDDFPSCDKSFLMGTGPFNIAMGDSQEIILAYIVAEGNDTFDTIRKLKEQIPFLQDLAKNNFDFDNLTVANFKSNPSGFRIYQNFPNPFNPITTITYTLDEQSEVKINIYDMLGKEVNQLVSSFQPSGTYSVQWNGDDNKRNLVGTGIYFYQIQAGEFVQTKKMVLMK
ncbi:T9SS type A sorting domain-containing protein [Candidatus Neomarinimicrobiota bacterium]